MQGGGTDLGRARAGGGVRRRVTARPTCGTLRRRRRRRDAAGAWRAGRAAAAAGRRAAAG